MAKEAERLLADSGWLPEPLRLAHLDIGAAAANSDDGGEPLPAFLASDEQDGLAEGEGEQQLDAAE